MGFEVIQGDCLEVMRGMASESVDAVITDPPYCSGGYLEAQKNTKAQGLRGATVGADDFKWFAGDNMSTGGLLWLLRGMMVEAMRVMKPNRSAFVFTDWRMVPHLAPALESSGLRYRNMIVWDKGNAGLGVGFKPAYEIILEFTKGNTEYQSLRGMNLIRVARVHASQKEHHAEKPVELISKLITVAVPEGGMVLDPFCGSGAIGEAAVKLGCGFIGVEREPQYADSARQRIDEVLAGQSLFGTVTKRNRAAASTTALCFDEPGNSDSPNPPSVTFGNNQPEYSTEAAVVQV